MKLDTKIRVHYECALRLTESEMRALDALAGYGIEEFIKAFYKVMGKSYLEPYSAGLRNLFAKIRTEGRAQLSIVDEARKALKEHGP